LIDLEEAVERVRSGDASAFQWIVDATSARLVRLSARMLGNVADAEDVVQEAYLKAYQSLLAGRFDGRAKVDTWLHRIVINATIDAKRKRRRAPAEPSTETLAAASQDTGSAEARLSLQELAEWLRGLPDDQHAVLVLKAIEELSSAQIAEILSCSEGAVEQRLVRARTSLRKWRDET
jgi:RNA polymerase sigma-70 factor, ECF subfamily